MKSVLTQDYATNKNKKNKPEIVPNQETYRIRIKVEFKVLEAQKDRDEEQEFCELMKMFFGPTTEPQNLHVF